MAENNEDIQYNTDTIDSQQRRTERDNREPMMNNSDNENGNDQNNQDDHSRAGTMDREAMGNRGMGAIDQENDMDKEEFGNTQGGYMGGDAPGVDNQGFVAVNQTDEIERFSDTQVGGNVNSTDMSFDPEILEADSTDDLDINQEKENRDANRGGFH